MRSLVRLKFLSPLLILAIALSLGSCGRKGDLEPPEGAVLKNRDVSKKPEVEDRPFVLDKLL